MATRSPANWKGKQFQREISSALLRGLKRAIVFNQGNIQMALSKSNRAGKGGAVNPKKGARRPVKRRHSQSGEPPRLGTGMLKRSLFTKVDRQKLAAWVATKLKYGVYMERGTRPHVITPSRRSVLVFAGQSTQKGGRWAWQFTKRVQHPGTKPRPFMWATIRKHREETKRMIFEPVKKMMRGTAEAPTLRPPT
jgi:hypothetical protein